MWGTDEQKAHYLPAHPVRRGHCGARATGAQRRQSDLATSACRAVLDGDQWVLNGQKIWTSAGHLADHIFTLARTDPDAPKHKGISFLLVDMRQPGIEVRPIKMISGESEFNEVFYTDATCPKDEVVGGVNNGWAVAMTLLGFERGEAAATVPDPLPGRARSAVRAGPGARRGRRSRSSASAWRGATSKVQIMRYIGMRTLTQFLARPPPGSRRVRSRSCTGASTTRSSPSWRSTSSAPTRWRRPGAARRRAFQTDDAGAPNFVRVWVGTFLNARAGTIYAGSSQIQRNIIGEMVLGLPKEPRAEAATWAEQQKAKV